MHAVQFTDIVVADIPTGAGSAPMVVAICTKTGALPFTPAIGLTIAFTDRGLEMGGDFTIEHVLWSHHDQKFYCEQHSRLAVHPEAIEAARDRQDHGWDVRYH